MVDGQLLFEEETALLRKGLFDVQNEVGLGLRVRNVLRRLYDEHQTGYGAEVVEALLRFAFNRSGLSFKPSPLSLGMFNGQKLGESPLDCWIIEDRLLFVFTALFEDNQFNISRGLSYMRSLGVPWGFAVNFGKRSVHMTGLSSSICGSALLSVVHNRRSND